MTHFLSLLEKIKEIKVDPDVYNAIRSNFRDHVREELGTGWN